MLSGEKRVVAVRRGMTVLGKIPAVPKPINLPSQRLENQGLDRDVELVPRGTMSWGSTGRSPPAAGSPWGNSAQLSSTSVSSGAGGSAAIPGTRSLSSSTIGGLGASALRPSSAGSGTRPSSAGQNKDQLASSHAWGLTFSRPSSASGILGQAQSQSIVIRPRSAETRPGGFQSSTALCADSVNQHTSGPIQAWGGCGSSGKLLEEPPQPARFTLTPVDFPTLGSDKNPGLRPHQTNFSSEHPVSADGTIFVEKERPSQQASASYEDLQVAPLGSCGSQEHNISENWCRNGPSFAGLPPAGGPWHREGPYTQMYAVPSDSWHRDAGHGAPTIDSQAVGTWRQGDSHVGTHGPSDCGEFPFDSLGFMPPFGPEVVTNGGRGPGPGGFDHHGEMYEKLEPLMCQRGVVPGCPRPLMGGDIHAGPLQFNQHYVLHGPPYGNIDERENMGGFGMVGRPGMNGSSHLPRLLHVHFDTHGPDAAGSGPCHQATQLENTRKQAGFMDFEGDGLCEASYIDLDKGKDGFGTNDGENFREGISYNSLRDADVGRKTVPVSGTALNAQKQSTQGTSSGGSHGHRDWGTACSSDEPMDFSKPVFGEDAKSVLPLSQGLSSSEVLPKERKLLDNKAPRCPVPSDIGCKLQVVYNGSKQVEKSSSHAVVSGEPEDLCDSSNVAMLDGENMKIQAKNRSKNEKSTGWNLYRGGSEILDSNQELQTKGRYLVESLKESKQDCAIFKQTLEDKGEIIERTSSFSVKSLSGGKEAYTSARFVVSTNDNSISEACQQTPGKVDISSQMPGFPSVSHVVVVTSVSTSKNQTVAVSQGRNLGSPIFEGEGLKNRGRLHILKRTGDICSDSLSNSIHLESSKGTATVKEPATKDDHKSKKIFNQFEGEKEWRPKLPAFEKRTYSTKSFRNPQAQSCKASATSTATTALEIKDSFEKGASESESSQLFDSYEYEAQRARHLEEEENMTKKKSAKGLAKLEKLNIGTSRVLRCSEATVSEESTKEANKSRPVALGANGLHFGVESAGGTIGPSGAMEVPELNLKIEPGEHGRDGKHTLSSREKFIRKASSLVQKDLPSGKTYSSENVSRTDLPLLPHLVQAASSEALLPFPVAPQMLQQQQLPMHQTVVPTQQQVFSRRKQLWQKNKQYFPQTKQHSSTENIEHLLPKQYVPQTKQRSSIVNIEHLLPASVDVTLEATEGITGSNDGWLLGSNEAYPTSLQASCENISSVSGSNEATRVLRRRRNNRNLKNKRRLEGPVITSEWSGTAQQGSGISDPSSVDGLLDDTPDGKHIKDVTGGSLSVEPADGIIAVEAQVLPGHEFVTIESGKEIVFGSVKEAAVTGMDMSRANKVSTSKMVQRKSDSLRRPFKEHGSQDPQVMEELCGNQRMVWAQSYTLSKQFEVGVEASKRPEKEDKIFPDSEDQSEENFSSPTLQSRRGELERHTPKPVARQKLHQGNDQQQVIATHSLPVQAYRNETSFSGESEAHVQDTGKLQPNLPTSGEPVSENKLSEVTRCGRLQTWRQRSSNENSYVRVASSNQAIGVGLGPSPLSQQVEGLSEQKQSVSQQLQSTCSKGAFPEWYTLEMSNELGLEPGPISIQPMKEDNLQIEAENSWQLGHTAGADFQRISLPSQEALFQDIHKDARNLQDNTCYHHALRSKFGRHYTCHGQFDCEHHRSIDSSTFQQSGKKQLCKQDTKVAEFQRENCIQDHEDAYCGPQSAGFHSIQQQGSLKGRQHSAPSTSSHLKSKSSTGRPKAGQIVANHHEREHPSPLTAQLLNQQFKIQGHSQSCDGHEQGLSDHTGRCLESAIEKEQVKSHALPLYGGDKGQFVPEIQHHYKSGQVNRPTKDSAHVASHQHKKKGLGHLQWQQTVPTLTAKLVPTSEKTDISLHQMPQSVSSLKSSESLQPTLHQNNRCDTSKMRVPLVGDSHKNTQYRPVSQAGQAVKQHNQKSAFAVKGIKSETKHRYTQQNNTHRLRDGDVRFYFKAREHDPPAHGRFTVHPRGGRGADMDSSREQPPKQGLVTDTTGGVIVSPVVG